MADIKQIQVGNTNYNIAGAAIILEDNGTTTDGVWLAKTSQITSLVDGQLFLYRPTKGTNSNNRTNTATLNITVNGTALGAKSVVVTGSDEYNATKTYLTSGIVPNITSLLLCYNSSENCFVVMNMPSQNLYLYSKIYNSRSGYYCDLEFTSHGVDIDSGNYFMHIKDAQVYLGGSNNNATFSGCTTKFNGSKIYILSNGSGMDFHPNRTKIYAHSQYTGENTAEMQLWSRDEDYQYDGLFINRPIYLASSNAVPTDATSSIQYNADEDCIEFVFK